MSARAVAGLAQCAEQAATCHTAEGGPPAAPSRSAPRFPVISSLCPSNKAEKCQKIYLQKFARARLSQKKPNISIT